MKTKLFLIGIILGFLNLEVDAQCKLETEIMQTYLKNAISENCNIQVETCTKLASIFKKATNTCVYQMAKSGENYYIFISYLRSYGSKIKIMKNNSLDIFLTNESKISLYPCGDYIGAYRGISIYNIGCFYQISKEQLAKLVDSLIVKLWMHYTSETEMEGSLTDTDGSFYMEYEISSKNYQENFSENASCILTMN